MRLASVAVFTILSMSCLTVSADDNGTTATPAQTTPAQNTAKQPSSTAQTKVNPQNGTGNPASQQSTTSKQAVQAQTNMKNAGVKATDAQTPTKEKVQSNIQLPPGTPVNTTVAPAAAPSADSTTLSAKTSTPNAPLATPNSTPSSVEAAVLKPVKAQLQDGTHIEINSDGTINVVENGTSTPAPDGLHTLRDGTTFQVRNGKRISNEDAEKM